MSEPKYVHRFPPCPPADTETMEAWLEDQARAGLLLGKDDLFFGFAEFIKGEPKKMRYRMVPLQKKTWLDGPSLSQAAVDLAADFGWEYCCTMGEFAVYSTENPDVPELNSDPAIHAMSLKRLEREQWRSLLWLGFLMALILGLLLREGPVSFILDQARFDWLLYMAIWIAAPWSVIRELRRVRRQRKQLLLGEPLERNREWRKVRKRYLLENLFVLVLVASYFITWFATLGSSWTKRHAIPMEDGLPFAVMEDLVEGEFRPNAIMQNLHDRSPYRYRGPFLLARRSHLLCREQVEFEQFGAMVQDGETLWDGSLTVEFYDFRTQWLADAYCEEVLARVGDELAVERLPIDKAWTWMDHGQCLLLRDGSRVVLVKLAQYHEESAIPFDTWALIMAEKLTE